MEIYIVQEGDTLQSIAEAYGVSEYLIAVTNEINRLESLVVGQTIVILIPEVVYTIQEGDTISEIASTYGITVNRIYQNNPQLIGNAENLMVGDDVVIKYQTEPIDTVSIYGYVYPYVDRNVLRKTLPYITYLSIFVYGFLEDGSLIEVDDEEIIEIARSYGTGALMTISAMTSSGVFSNELANLLFQSQDLQEILINNILEAVRRKGFAGVDLDFEYIYASDREKYIQFAARLRRRLEEIGGVLFVDLAPKVSADQQGLLYEGHDYRGLGNAVDYVLLMTYEWGYTYGPPMAVSPINNVKRVLNYGITEILPSKIFMGFSNYGYDWPLPFEKGVTAARTIGNVEAVNQARDYGAIIFYNEEAQAPYYTYIASDGIEHIVYFEDARSVNARLNLIPVYELQGPGYWNLMKYFPQNWLIASQLFVINKL